MLLLIWSILWTSMGTCLWILHRGISPRKDLVMTKLIRLLLYTLFFSSLWLWPREESEKEHTSVCFLSMGVYPSVRTLLPYHTVHCCTLSIICVRQYVIFITRVFSLFVTQGGFRILHTQASWIRIQILLSSSKIVRKTLIPTVLWLLVDFLSLKNDVNVPSKSNK